MSTICWRKIGYSCNLKTNRSNNYNEIFCTCILNKYIFQFFQLLFKQSKYLWNIFFYYNWYILVIFSVTLTETFNFYWTKQIQNIILIFFYYYIKYNWLWFILPIFYIFFKIIFSVTFSRLTLFFDSLSIERVHTSIQWIRLFSLYYLHNIFLRNFKIAHISFLLIKKKSIMAISKFK